MDSQEIAEIRKQLQEDFDADRKKKKVKNRQKLFFLGIFLFILIPLYLYQANIESMSSFFAGAITVILLSVGGAWCLEISTDV